jgi:hypothetical protein
VDGQRRVPERYEPACGNLTKASRVLAAPTGEKYLERSRDQASRGSPPPLPALYASMADHGGRSPYADDFFVRYLDRAKALERSSKNCCWMVFAGGDMPGAMIFRLHAVGTINYRAGIALPE